MSIFKRIAAVFASPEHEAMAGTIGDRLTRAFALLNKSEQQEAIQELSGLSQEVAAFVERRSTSELKRAVEHWALHGALSGERATIVATFFADNDDIRKLAAVVREGDASQGAGLIWLQEAFNEAGLIMGPTIHDRETGHLQDIIRRTFDEVTGKGGGPSDPVQEIADVLWPATEDEAALRTRIARASGVSSARVAAELYALRRYAFELALNIALPDPAQRDHLFETGVYLALTDRTDLNEHVQSPGWLRQAVQGYASTGHQNGDGPWAAESTKWMARVRTLFEARLGKAGSGVGLIGAAEFDGALDRLRKLMEQRTSP